MTTYTQYLHSPRHVTTLLPRVPPSARNINIMYDLSITSTVILPICKSLDVPPAWKVTIREHSTGNIRVVHHFSSRFLECLNEDWTSIASLHTGYSLIYHLNLGWMTLCNWVNTPPTHLRSLAPSTLLLSSLADWEASTHLQYLATRTSYFNQDSWALRRSPGIFLETM